MNWLRKLMYGRYGSDPLTVFLLGLYLVLYLLATVFGVPVLSAVAFALGLLALLRMFSKNLEKRRRENAKFMELAGPIIHWFKMHRTIHKDREHCYFKCPNCGQYLRVPRGKGKITVTCRSCGVSFEEKS